VRLPQLKSPVTIPKRFSPQYHNQVAIPGNAVVPYQRIIVHGRIAPEYFPEFLPYCREIAGIRFPRDAVG